LSSAPSTNNVAEIVHAQMMSTGTNDQDLYQSLLYDLTDAILLHAYIEKYVQGSSVVINNNFSRSSRPTLQNSQASDHAVQEPLYF
jgi:hypothetical protein